MALDYLHNHPDFKSLLSILESETGIQAGLIEKDYWIMHVLYGLKKQGYEFELKGGTSLSKGFAIIERFSEDIDMLIHPRHEQGVDENPKHEKEKQVLSRKSFYDRLAKEISIEGIETVSRDQVFDDLDKYRSGGIRLQYKSFFPAVEGVKEGILLEVGFDDVSPNLPCDISSWANDRASKTIGTSTIDNRAKEIRCYHPGYTFVEKLQTIATKFRHEQETGTEFQNFMRQYYDVSNLLKNKDVNDFIGTEAYYKHKEKRFPKKDRDIPIAGNEAFLLNNEKLREKFKARFKQTKSLYYKGQPDFEELLATIKENITRL